MPTQTRYYRADTWTINGLSAYQLGTARTGTEKYLTISAPAPLAGFYNSDVIIRKADGTETMIGSAVAQTYRTSGGGGYQSETWACPNTVLASTDAIRIRERVKLNSGANTENFITEQLGWTNLDSATWTFTRYTYYNYNEGSGISEALTYWGISTRDTRIEGISYTVYINIGLKIYDGVAVRNIGCLTALAGQKLRIAKAGTIYAIALVPTTDAAASKIRIYDGASVKALVKL